MSADKVPMPTVIAKVEKLLDYRFSNASLIEEALTHSSDAGHTTHQRLEFVGDAALGLAFANYFFLTHPSLGPGDMTDLRADNINTKKLARVAVRHGLYGFLRRHNTAQLDQIVEEFTKAVDGLPYGGTSVKAPKVLADVVESIAAAVYIDCGFNLDELWKVFRGILEPIIIGKTYGEQPVTALHLYCQKKGKSYFNESEKALLNLSSSESSETDADGAREEEDYYKQTLYRLCTKKRWRKPVYSYRPWWWWWKEKRR